MGGAGRCGQVGRAAKRAPAFGRLIERVLFEVKATDPSTIATPLLTLAVAAALAALPPAIRAARIDPAQTLRSE